MVEAVGSLGESGQVRRRVALCGLAFLQEAGPGPPRGGRDVRVEFVYCPVYTDGKVSLGWALKHSRRFRTSDNPVPLGSVTVIREASNAL